MDYNEEDSLIRRCQAGEMMAYRQLYEHWGQPLIRTALRILEHQQDAEDAVQQTFIRLYRSIQNYRFESEFSTYLFRILMNVCFDMLKKRKKHRMRRLDAVVSSMPADEELRWQLQQAIDQLPQRMKACFVLFAVEGFKQDEIAKMLDLSLGGVKSNIFHAKVRLRKMLADEGMGI